MRIATLAAAAAIVALAGAADAGSGKGKGHNKAFGHGGHAIGAHCPPGLAKKNPPCVPPGLAKKRGYYGVGDIIYDDYRIIRDRDYRRYGLDRDETYYRVGNNVYRVDRDTREVLEFMGALSALLN